MPDRYGERECRFLKAYALSVLADWGDVDESVVADFLSDVDDESLPLEAAGWLLPIVDRDGPLFERLMRLLRNSAGRAGSAIRFTMSYAGGARFLIHSDRVADAVILGALIAADPGNAMIPQIARGILDSRRNGRWESTFENALALQALKRYFIACEAHAAGFKAGVWLDDEFLGGRLFERSDIATYRLELPLDRLLNGGRQTVFKIAREGQGRLYYRLEFSYALSDTDLKALNRGFHVDRAYETVGSCDGVRKGGDGAWIVKPGTAVRVKLRIVTAMPRFHVALVDPLPAGLEPVNVDLAVSDPFLADLLADDTRPSQAAFRSPAGVGIESGIEATALQLHDDRVEAFTAMLPAGTYVFSYVARATTKGFFNVPPAKAEEMYHPANFGRTAKDRVIVE